MVRLILLLVLTVAGTGQAAIDAYPFPNEELEVRYDQLIAELRCPQCLNTNLAGSDAMIAQDLRREVHRMLLEDYTDREILDFMHERYGDFILYEPRVSPATWALWFSPLVLLMLAGLIWFRMTRREIVDTALSDNEQSRLEQLLKDGQN